MQAPNRLVQQHIIGAINWTEQRSLLLYGPRVAEGIKESTVLLLHVAAVDRGHNLRYRGVRDGRRDGFRQVGWQLVADAIRAVGLSTRFMGVKKEGGVALNEPK